MKNEHRPTLHNSIVLSICMPKSSNFDEDLYLIFKIILKTHNHFCGCLFSDNHFSIFCAWFC